MNSDTQPIARLAQETKAVHVTLDGQRKKLYDKLEKLDVERKETQAHIAHIKSEMESVAAAYEALTTKAIPTVDSEPLDFPETEYFEEEVTSHHGLR